MTRRIWWTVLALAVAASRAHAQEISPLDPPDVSRYLRWGPFRVRPSLAIPTLGYDNNVFYTTGAQPTTGDYFLALVPRAEGVVLFGHRAFLTFDERLELYGYVHEHSANYFNQLGKARLTVPFARWGVYADLGYYRLRDRPVDALDQRPIRIEKPVGFGAIVKFGWRTDAEFGFTRLRATASDPDEKLFCTPGVDPGCFSISERNDRVETGIRVVARYLAFGRARVIVQASSRDIVFDDPAVGRDGRERRIVPGLDFGLGGRVYGTFHIGYSNFHLADPAATSFQGTVADAAVGYRLGGAGSTLTLTGTRDVRFTIYESTELYRYTSGDLTFVKYFNRLVGMEAGAGLGDVVFIGDPTGRRDVYRNGQLGIRLRVSENELGRRVEYAFRFIRSQVTSSCDAPPLNCSNLDQNRGTVGFGVLYGY